MGEPGTRGCAAADQLNRDKMEKAMPELRKLRYDPGKYDTYLEQLGIKYPTVRSR